MKIMLKTAHLDLEPIPTNYISTSNSCHLNIAYLLISIRKRECARFSHVLLTPIWLCMYFQKCNEQINKKLGTESRDLVWNWTLNYTRAGICGSDSYSDDVAMHNRSVWYFLIASFFKTIWEDNVSCVARSGYGRKWKSNGLSGQRLNVVSS